MVVRIATFPIQENLPSAVVRRYVPQVGGDTVFIEGGAVEVLSWRGAIVPAVCAHCIADVLEVAVGVSLQQKPDGDPALIRGIALIVARGEGESAVHALKIGDGHDLFGWFDDLCHGLVIGERVG